MRYTIATGTEILINSGIIEAQRKATMFGSGVNVRQRNMNDGVCSRKTVFLPNYRRD